MHGVVPTKMQMQEKDKRNQSVGGNMNRVAKSKDKNFRIMKKAILEKKEEPFGMGNLGMIMVTGLGQGTGSSQIPQTITGYNMPPRMKPNMKSSNYR